MPPSELPSLRSALRRTGIAETPDRERPDWILFAGRQLFRAGGAALPYALPWKYGFPEPKSPPLLGVAVGILAVGGGLAGAALARRYRALWATLALFGFFWALPMRANTACFCRDFAAVFYVGVPLALFGLALARARGLWGERAVAAAGVAAVAVFAVSAFQIQTAELFGDAENPETRKAEMADFDVIREKTRGGVVAVIPEVFDFDPSDLVMDYYLAGSVLIKGEPTLPQMRHVDFIASRGRKERGFSPLTPENREIFLHAAPRDPLDFYRAERRRVESRQPAARSVFDLYLDGGDLYYIKDPCAEEDTRGGFFLSVHPVHLERLAEDRRALGHDSLNFYFAQRGTPVFDGACMAKAPLPEYPVRIIETGRRTPAGERTEWRAAINPPLSARSVARYERVYQAAKASGEPLASSGFDIYMEGGALTYLKAPCAESDARGRFFLSVRPVNIADLPEDRRALGHASLNFDFSPDGIIFGGKCMIRRELPDYDIAEISTGQDVPGEGRAWSAERLPISAAAVARYEAAYEAVKSSGDPVIRSDFDVYLEGGALTYLKDPCAPDDARGRFFLSVHPVNIADLPEDRREIGHAGLNFDFSPDGIIFAGKCMIRRELPGYDIAEITTGQDVAGEGRLWSGEAAVGD